MPCVLSCEPARFECGGYVSPHNHLMIAQISSPCLSSLLTHTIGPTWPFNFLQLRYSYTNVARLSYFQASDIPRRSVCPSHIPASPFRSTSTDLNSTMTLIPTPSIPMKSETPSRSGQSGYSIVSCLDLPFDSRSLQLDNRRTDPNSPTHKS